jgi:hypothetical protein
MDRSGGLIAGEDLETSIAANQQDVIGVSTVL